MAGERKDTGPFRPEIYLIGLLILLEYIHYRGIDAFVIFKALPWNRSYCKINPFKTGTY